MAGSDPRPVPQADAVSCFFWEGAKRGELLVQRCSSCGCYQFPPDVCCVYCQSVELVPTAVSGVGTLYSYAVVERPFHAGFVDAVPYVVGLVELREQAGLKILTNVVDADPASLRVGMPVEVVFERRDDVVLPQFHPTGGGA